jgi:hypothetical protein
MPLFAVEREHPVCMLPSLDQMAEPKMGVHGGVVPDDQEIRVSVGLGGVLISCATHRSDSATRPRANTWADSPRNIGTRASFAAKRVRRPQRRMQTVPDLLR